MKVTPDRLFSVATNLEHVKHPYALGKLVKSSAKDKALGVFLFVLTGLLTAGVMPIFYLATAYKKIKTLPEDSSPLTQKTEALAKPIINEKLFKQTDIDSLEKTLNKTPSLVNTVNENKESLIDVAAKQENTELNRVEPFFYNFGQKFLKETQPAIQSLVQNLPPAYYCFQVWGAPRKTGALEGGLKEIKKKFQDAEGKFENKLPVVMVIIRPSVKEEVAMGEFSEETLEDYRKKGIACIVAMNAYNGKVIPGEDFDKAVASIKETCNHWTPSPKITLRNDTSGSI